MNKINYEQTPIVKIIMGLMGSKILTNPINLTRARSGGGGQPELKTSNILGTLGLAISEPLKKTAGRDDINYALGSILNKIPHIYQENFSSYTFFTH
ncbi:MAG: hypothetical protein AMR96_05110 [Candidatus Adiutrix intracellularis]|nr:MAG: hypothetical protein AMR96_05110 [Candidatus Adiutrix intracellularis]